VPTSRHAHLHGARVARVSPAVAALVVSATAHAALLAATGLLPVTSSAPRAQPDDRPVTLTPVERATARVDVVAATPVAPRADHGALARDDDLPIAATLLDAADETPPPAAAPTIAVDGGTRGVGAPSAWSLRPSIGRSVFVGRGRGSRHDRRRPESAGSVSGGATAAATEVVAPPVLAVRTAVPLRVGARLVAYAPPPYPPSARDRGLEGAVRLDVDVDADGAVGEIRVTVSSGAASLDDAAVAAVRRWRFAPATIDGAAVPSTVTLPPIRFRLE
jgi:periplasmic protein TonB